MARQASVSGYEEEVLCAICAPNPVLGERVLIPEQRAITEASEDASLLSYEHPGGQAVGPAHQ